MSVTQNFKTVDIDRQASATLRSGAADDGSLYTPIYALTIFFGAVFIIGPFVVRKGPNKGITQCCIMLAAVCLWLFWVTTYIAQMNPLLGPRLQNTTLAWLGHKWGKDPKKLGGDLEEND